MENNKNNKVEYATVWVSVVIWGNKKDDWNDKKSYREFSTREEAIDNAKWERDLYFELKRTIKKCIVYKCEKTISNEEEVK